MIETDQMSTWRGDFGKSYTDRNPKTVEDVEALSFQNFGISRISLNDKFLTEIPKNARILEVGCNVGSQLAVLAEMGFQHLYGIEVQRYAVEIAKHNCPGIDVIEGSAFDIPFKDNFFDLVFTSGVLIHISPENLHQAISEIVRCSRSFIWG
ncbi:MAG: pseudaminic acid biosynthesis-associated methylase, partial [Gammaproteobacteria bacterium]